MKFADLGNSAKQFRVDCRTVGRLKSINVLDLDRRIGDQPREFRKKGLRIFSRQQAHIEIAARGVGNHVGLLLLKNSQIQRRPQNLECGGSDAALD